MLKDFETRIVLNEHELFDVKYFNRKCKKGLFQQKMASLNVISPADEWVACVKSKKIANA